MAPEDRTPASWSAEEVHPGVWVGFTTTGTGNLALHVGDDPAQVTARRAALNADLGAHTGGPVHLQYMQQVHGADVVTVTTPGADPVADALLSARTGLAVMVADCVPVVLLGLTAQGQPLLGVVHAGRPGVQADVIGASVQALHDAGAVTLQAWLGPSVCGACYEVPAALRATVAASHPDAWATTRWGTPALDLPAAVVARLAALQVPVRGRGVCTLEHREYFSHRRSQRDGDPEGRFIGFAVLGQPAAPSLPTQP